MSDSDIGLDEELLALAEGSNKRKKKQSSSNSRVKRPKHDSTSEVEVESEEDEYDDPFPLEGFFLNEQDRARLMDMNEVERESIIADRQEQKRKTEERKEISRLTSHRSQDPLVPKPAKRQQTQRTATNEKRDKLDELKAKRKAKIEKKQIKAPSANPSTSDSGEDMETSSDEEDYTSHAKEAPPVREDDGDIELIHLERCIITRDKLEKHYHTPWFEEWVKGTYVRYLIGNEGSEKRYRICQVVGIAPPSKTGGYSLGNTTVHHNLDLKHGSATKSFGMCEVSNSAPTVREFNRWKFQCQTDKEELPKKPDFVRKLAEMKSIESRTITDDDISAMITKKTFKPSNSDMLMRSRLLQERTLAKRRHDFAEVREIDQKLENLGYSEKDLKSTSGVTTEDRLAKVNERNRKANIDAIRRAELQEVERRRRDRKLALSGNASTSSDPSARLKTIIHGSSPASRAGTPNVDSGITAGPQTSPAKSKTLESMVLQSLDVDLGDF